jgi:hypothetical protein
MHAFRTASPKTVLVMVIVIIAISISIAEVQVKSIVVVIAMSVVAVVFLLPTVGVAHWNALAPSVSPHAGSASVNYTFDRRCAFVAHQGDRHCQSAAG